VLDAFVAFIAALSGLPEAYHSANGTASATEHPWGLALAVFLSAAPLLVRRIWPVPVFGCVLAVSLGVAIDQHTANGLALLIALYTVTAMRPRREALACAGVLELFIVACTIWLAGTSWWYPAIFLSGLVGAAVGLGLYSATRVAYLAELRDRAARLERERDQQGALAAAAERARIAREMHDIVAHHLTVMVTLSDAAVAVSDSSPERSERATDVMRRVSATGRTALADTRRLLGVLREPPAADGSLSAADEAAQARQPVPGLAQLDALIEQVRSAGLDTTLEVSGEAPDVPVGVQLTVYRLVQEALTNTLKHGRAGARAAVRLRFQPGELLVDIDDDGAGAPPARPAATASAAASGSAATPASAAASSSTSGSASTAASASAPVSAGGGLIGMRERARVYGGDVQAGPRETGGWKVSARLQLDAGDAS
jgi:signal transduction histidine kinase